MSFRVLPVLRVQSAANACNVNNNGNANNWNASNVIGVRPDFATAHTFTGYDPACGYEKGGSILPAALPVNANHNRLRLRLYGYRVVLL